MSGIEKKIGGLSTGQPVSDEAIFKVTKEIIVKFIEVGRLSPSDFDETFAQVYKAVEGTVRTK